MARAPLRMLLVGRRDVRVLLALLAYLEERLDLLELQLHRLRHRASAKSVQLALALTQEKDEDKD